MNLFLQNAFEIQISISEEEMFDLNRVFDK